MKNPIGTINGVYFRQSDLDFGLEMIGKYTRDVERYARELERADARHRGVTTVRLNQARRDLARWQKSNAEMKARVGKFGTVIFDPEEKEEELKHRAR